MIWLIIGLSPFTLLGIWVAYSAFKHGMEKARVDSFENKIKELMDEKGPSNV